MLPIDLALFDARDRALPGREQATLNELCRAIVELVRRPDRSRPGQSGTLTRAQPLPGLWRSPRGL
jgi:hypothetical protein